MNAGGDLFTDAAEPIRTRPKKMAERERYPKPENMCFTRAGM